MKLRIFLAPFQLIDEKNKKLYTLNESTLITKDLGNVFLVFSLLSYAYRTLINNVFLMDISPAAVSSQLHIVHTYNSHHTKGKPSLGTIL